MELHKIIKIKQSLIKSLKRNYKNMLFFYGKFNNSTIHNIPDVVGGSKIISNH